MGNATIQDVAREAGVSITTVSRVLNNNYPVKKETRQRVETAIERLRFTPNVLARGLIQKKTYTVGVLVPSITNPFFPLVVNGIQEHLGASGYQIFLCDTAGEPQQEAVFLRQLIERRVDGIITVDPRTVNIREGVYTRAAEQVPLVLVNGYNDGIGLDFVMNDQMPGSLEALEYLVSLGHREIALVRGPQSYSYDLKEKAYWDTLAAHGIPFQEEHLIRIASGNSVQTMEMAAAAVGRALGSARPPTAIFACNDWMAVGALNAARLLGVQVPGRLSVIGCDNTAISEVVMPKLTTVDHNMYRLGRAAAERLVDRMEQGGKETGKVIFETKLIKRDSCTQAACGLE